MNEGKRLVNKNKKTACACALADVERKKKRSDWIPTLVPERTTVKKKRIRFGTRRRKVLRRIE